MYIGKKILARRSMPAPKLRLKKPLLLAPPQPVLMPLPADWPKHAAVAAKRNSQL
jgi:hypothetical protein